MQSWWQRRWRFSRHTHIHTRSLVLERSHTKCMSENENDEHEEEEEIQYRFVVIGAQLASLFEHFRRRGFVQVLGLVGVAAAHRSKNCTYTLFIHIPADIHILFFWIYSARSAVVDGRRRRRRRVCENSNDFSNEVKKGKIRIQVFECWTVAFSLNVIIHSLLERQSLSSVGFVFSSDFPLRLFCAPISQRRISRQFVNFRLSRMDPIIHLSLRSPLLKFDIFSIDFFVSNINFDH